MSVDHHSEQSSDIIVGDVTTVTTYSGDYRDQSATTNESRDEVDVTEMLSLTTQLANFSITSANLTGRMLEPPSAHDRICRKRTCHNSHHVLQHYLHGRQSYPQHCVHATLQVPRLFGVITTQSQGVQGDVADPEKGFWAVFMMISISRMDLTTTWGLLDTYRPTSIVCHNAGVISDQNAN
ncbi:hypothetical protein FOIG_09894 [Fusarium odoratissimum NRRL 54006]|uniref:Uncharacterized protein n=2 Tax=Fusarium oxysporum species complex TaxID=171631 RepID=X0KNH4_FUSO5|nr:uncharacterized protein FOIG_09894 [Fusarium odoratissimum NRRL 54006]EXL98344.1 hypothetical protein FOIG_09894 [Fusarium odoratissimum NRRL 54006]TXB96134.1 hypothetical protein FocTR4_00016435 [Fusarium oxysporum f. sp. cubense]